MGRFTNDPHSHDTKYWPSQISIEPTAVVRNEESRHSRPGRGKNFLRSLSLLLIVLFASAVFGVTAWYARATFTSRQTLSRVLKVEAGSSLAILRVLQAVLSAATTLAVVKAFERMQWALASGQRGVGVLKFLGIAPTTTFLGTVGIILDIQAGLSDRFWAFIRVFLTLATWLAGVLLFIRTSLTVAYDPVYTYNVTAGIGEFNGSFVQPYLDKLNSVDPDYNKVIVPYNMQALVYNLVGNSMQAFVAPPIDYKCNSTSCQSFLVTGGLIITTPWGPTGYPDYPITKIDDVPAIQIEFKSGSSGDYQFSTDDCNVYGADGILIGIKFCVSKNAAVSGSYLAGIYVCQNGTESGQCHSSDPAPNVTTTFSVYSRKVDMILSRSNYSILSIPEMSKPSISSDINLPAYRLALGWLLDFNASGIPAPSSIAEQFWTSQDQISDPYWFSESYRIFQSLLAFPIWQFNPNNFGNTDLLPRTVISGLPDEFYTTASISKPYLRIVVNPSMYMAFILVQSVVILFVWGVLMWLCLSSYRLPKISSYPLVDVVLKARISASEETISTSVNSFTGGFSGASDRDIRSRLKGSAIQNIS